jgi:hypothetical protein
VHTININIKRRKEKRREKIWNGRADGGKNVSESTRHYSPPGK